MKPLPALLWMAAGGLAAPLAYGDIVFSADFQDGKTSGWNASGTADIRLTSYGNNISLRIMNGAAAVATLSTRHYRDIVVTSAFAAQGHGEGGACVAEVSIDGGRHWLEVWRTTAAMDDGVILHRGGGPIESLSDQERVLLRLRNAAEHRAICWADDIAVTGTLTLADGGSRTVLNAASLLTSHAPGPWPMSAFSTPAAPQDHSRNVFEGTLRLLGERAEKGFTVLTDRYGDAQANGAKATHLPAFDFEFVQSGDALIPLRRGSIPGGNAEWEFILEPGRVWDERADEGYSRAALPFTLEERNANCMHNGVLTFLFRSDGAVSSVAFEIAHETCAYFQFNWWGYAQAQYAPHPVMGREAVEARYREEVDSRLPTRALSALATDFPTARPEQFASPLEVPPQSVAAHGLIIDGIHYVGECVTRFGEYPFCDVLDLPSYSLSKSIVGGMATMRLAASHPQLAHALIIDWVPECAAHGGWQGVTLINALDMATGHYLSAADQHDEDAADILPFFIADSHAEKLTFACRHYPRRANPGERWVYHTADTYLLGSALNAIYRAKAGPGADFYRDLLAKELWPLLRLSPVLDVPRRTYDAAAQPFTGYGLTLHRDDIAKIGIFLNVDRGRSSTGQLLDGALLDAALQRNPDQPGLRAGADELRYNHGFWGWNAQRTLGCAQPTWIPFMSGYGGIVVALLPNGMIYYYFSDGGIHRWAMAAAEANRIRPFCRK